MRLLNKISLVFSLAWLGSTSLAAEEKDRVLRLEVIDPFVEMHTGPAKGYPVFYTAEQGEYVEILTRRPDWYELRTQNGRTGWAKANQIARTLLPTGEPVDLPSVSFGDYLANSWLVGFSAGQFSSGELNGSDSFSFTIGYRPLSWLEVEAESGKFFESDIKGRHNSLNVIFEPFSDWQLSPTLLLGGGVMVIDSQPELAPLDIDDSNFYSYGLGLNYYIGRNFVLRGGFRGYQVSTDQNDERLVRWNIGFNAFF